ncbi:MAG: hypothetical protein M0P35_10480 [Bacteroidales bacterium]|jgi:hypothetical protein|nr:hypothetical protein [Bacteroidales bacterium]MDD2205710.1 hypothetical protein [Bacteroidales bacterium]
MKAVSNLFIIFFFFGILLPICGLSQSSVVVSQMEALDYTARTNGYYYITHFYNTLNDGYYRTHQVYLAAGQNYLVHALCDEDCTDIDVEIIDAYGNVIDDNDDSDLAICKFYVYSSGNFTVKITMYDCEYSPCSYGVGVYGRYY